jgi:hypothetical protein
MKAVCEVEAERNDDDDDEKNIVHQFTRAKRRVKLGPLEMRSIFSGS